MQTCKSGKLSIRCHLQSFSRVFVVFPSSGPITIIGFCLCLFSPRSRKKVGSVFILHARCPRAHVKHVIKEANSTTNNGMSFLKVLTLISLFSLQSVTVFNIGVPFSLGFSTAGQPVFMERTLHFYDRNFLPSYAEQFSNLKV